MKQKQITLPCFGITINLTGDGGGAISSTLKESCTCFSGECPGCFYNTAMDGIESLILGHAVAGIDVEAPAYIEGIETAVQAAANNI